MTKPVERGVARGLRAEYGTPIKRLAKLLEVSPATASLWVRDIEITPEQVRRNASRAGKARGDTWRDLNRARRRRHQLEGRARARLREPLHFAGCMLYWAEGAKERNSVKFCNSDPEMVRFFRVFLRESLAVDTNRLSISLNVYTNNGMTIREVEDFWLGLLYLPR